MSLTFGGRDGDNISLHCDGCRLQTMLRRIEIELEDKNSFFHQRNEEEDFKKLWMIFQLFYLVLTFFLKSQFLHNSRSKTSSGII